MASGRGLGDASLSWVEMLLIVALPQPSPQLRLDLEINEELSCTRGK